ncbi:cation diffusion facilitator family transporter [Xanthobacter sp. V4C-4]|uniref:cation diffusion facilitator family transporter n=1 Tax=Xanthobacter cornucopiae TaxID=3119924 RepID=UPI00372BD808
MTAPSPLVFGLAVALNLGFVATEAVVGLWAGSLALEADAGHNLFDVLGLLLASGAAWLLRRSARTGAAFGPGGLPFLAIFANAVLLLVGTGAIIVEAVLRFFSPHPVHTGVVMAAASVGLVIKVTTAALLMRGGAGRRRQGAGLRVAADGAVSLAVVAAAAGIALTGWLWLDPAVSLVIAGIILASTWRLARDSFSVNATEVGEAADRAEILAYLSQLPGVSAVTELRIWRANAAELAACAHLVRPGATLDDAFLARASEHLRVCFGISLVTLQVEEGGAAAPSVAAPGR